MTLPHPMPHDILPDVTSSRSRLRIANLVSERPHGLKELARATGISMQGVLKHLKMLESLGLAQEMTVRGPELSVRKLYTTGKSRMKDFSAEGLMLVKLSQEPSQDSLDAGRTPDIEDLAEETILQKRRVKEQARRLGRMIDDLVEDESRIRSAVMKMSLTDTERLVLQVIFAEETLVEGERVLVDDFGLRGGTDSIAKTLAKARRHHRKGRAPRL